MDEFIEGYRTVATWAFTATLVIGFFVCIAASLDRRSDDHLSKPEDWGL